jgi:hypothetical protein
MIGFSGEEPQRMMDSPQPPRAFVDFSTSAYQAIDDRAEPLPRK